jgi:hypothetical protein
MSMRPLPQKRQPSLVAKALGLALAPAFYGLQLSSGVVGFGVKQATAMLQLPLRILVTMLTLADALICDVLVMLSKQPGLRAQVRLCGSGCRRGRGPWLPLGVGRVVVAVGTHTIA